MALQRVSIPSPNYSSRGGQTVRLVVVHASEGAMTKEALGSFFSRSSSKVSSHVGIDDSPAIAQYVPRSYSAWTSANANPCSIQAELCVPSGASMGWSRSQWNSHPTMLKNTAAWIAEECAAFGIPIRRLSPAQAQGGIAGVCQHADLGSWGGGHVDCGPNFPMDDVMKMAAGQVPAPSPDEDDEMDARIATNPNNGSKALLDLATGEYKGLSSPEMLNYLKAQGVKDATGLTPSQWGKLKQVGTL